MRPLMGKYLGHRSRFWDAFHFSFPDANADPVDLATIINLNCVANSYKL